MASKNFNFGKVKRSFLTTTLLDGTVLVVNMPKKSTFEKMNELSNIDEESARDTEVYNNILELMAEILSNNKNGKKIEAGYLEKQGYDIELIISFLNEYSDFVKSIRNDPNLNCRTTRPNWERRHTTK